MVEKIKFLCDVCDDHEERATFYCQDCSYYYCEPDFKNFHSSGVFKSHRFLRNLEELPSLACGAHKKYLSHYCKDDSEFLCYICALSDVHLGHKIKEANELARDAANRISQDGNVIKSTVIELLKTEYELTENLGKVPGQNFQLINDLKTHLKNTKERIYEARNNFGEKVALLDQRRISELKEQIELLNNFKVIIKSTIAKINQTLESENKLELVKFSKGELYQLATKKNFENMQAAIEKGASILSNIPKIDLSKEFYGNQSLYISPESHLMMNYENNNFLCLLTQTVRLRLLDHFSKEMFLPRNEIFAKCWSVQEETNKRRYHLVRHEPATMSYYVEFNFLDMGKHLIYVTINKNMLASCPITVEVYPSNCKPLRDYLHVCKGRDNGCPSGATLYGSNPYYGSPNTCAGALHSGAISPNGGTFYVKPIGGQYIRKSTYNGITSSEVKGHFESNSIILKRECGHMKENIWCCIGRKEGCKSISDAKASKTNPGVYKKGVNLCQAALDEEIITVEGGIFYVEPFKDLRQSLKAKSGDEEFVRLFGLCGHIQKNIYYCKGAANGCAGKTSNYVFGSNPYTFESDFCGCALHAGAIGENGGFYICNKVGTRSNFTQSLKNGVKSIAYSAYQAVEIQKFAKDLISDQVVIPINDTGAEPHFIMPCEMDY